MELPSASIAPDAPITDKSVLPEVIFSYDRGARVSLDAIKEYERHIKNYTANLSNYQSHMAGLRAQAALMEADRDYLKAMQASGSERQALLQSAAKHYVDSIQANIYIVLKYYVPDDLAKQVFPSGVTRDNVEQLPPQQFIPTYFAAMQALAHVRFDPDQEDRSDYQRYIDRAFARLKEIPGAAPATAPAGATTAPATGAVRK